MSEQIVINIKKLGSVRDAKITLGQFMIFSGASGLGKSYVAMLVHYVYMVLSGEMIEEYVVNQGATLRDAALYTDGATHEVHSFNTKDLLLWLNAHAKVYLQGLLGYSDLEMDVDIVFPKLPDVLQVTSLLHNSDESRAMLELRVNGEQHVSHAVATSIIQIVDTQVIAGVIASYICYKSSYHSKSATLFFPPSRGALMQLSPKDRYNFVQSSPMYKEYMQSLLEIRSTRFAVSSEPIPTSKIAAGELIEDGDDFAYKVSGAMLPISATASSIKEITPLLLLAQKGIASSYSILFEEPESHLHPEMQNAMVDVLVQMINQGTGIQITTHSDYVLRRINDLIYLAKLKETWPEDKYLTYCKKHGLDPTIVLNPIRIKAYYFKAGKNGVSSVVEQDLSDGIPFDTFDSVIEKNFSTSADLYEQFSMITAHD